PFLHVPLFFYTTTAPPPLPPLSLHDALPIFDHATAERLLERYGDFIAALAGRAIARAWDQGRLTFPDQGELPYKIEVGGLLGKKDRKSTRLNSSHVKISYAVFCLKKKKKTRR